MVYKLIYLARRAPDVSREDWPEVWCSHTNFTRQFSFLASKIHQSRYCNRIDSPRLEGRPVDLPGLSTEHDGIAIAASEGLDGLDGTHFSKDDRALIDQDERRVFDRLTPDYSFYCEQTLTHGNAVGATAMVRFIAGRPGASREEFDAHWHGAHIERAKATLDSTGWVSGYVQNKPVRAAPTMFPSVWGIAEYWFPDPFNAVRLIRDDAFRAIDDDLDVICDPDNSITMLTQVIRHR